jgi:hypothetical protein
MAIDLVNSDCKGHLLGIHRFIHAQEHSAVHGSLRQAAWWVGIRQEISMAFLSQRNVRVPLEYCNLDRSFSPAQDDTWAFRIIVHCVDVLAFCFGEGQSSLSQYQDLVNYSEGWMNSKPLDFDPIYTRAPVHSKSEAFPVIWYHLDCHGMIQHSLPTSQLS